MDVVVVLITTFSTTTATQWCPSNHLAPSIVYGKMQPASCDRCVSLCTVVQWCYSVPSKWPPAKGAPFYQVKISACTV